MRRSLLFFVSKLVFMVPLFFLVMSQSNWQTAGAVVLFAHAVGPNTEL